MKILIMISVILAIFALILPIALSLANPLPPAIGEETTEQPADSTAPAETEPAVHEDDEITLRLLTDGQVEEVTMFDYLVGVVAAEMPASFQPEALKAQAVAARTYALYRILASSSDNHDAADVCDDSACCNAYKSLSELAEKWGDNYESYLKKIKAAVRGTDGICLLYEDEPILAVFHSSSAGNTEASQNVWSSALPYLVSVISPETEEQVPDYVSSVTVSQADFKETLQRVYPEADLAGDASGWIGDITYTESGRIDTIMIGGFAVEGTALRALFDLRSTAVGLTVEEGSVTFLTTGYGHGVGMSQYGADTLAEEGYTFREILLWYYTGVTFGNMTDLF